MSLLCPHFVPDYFCKVHDVLTAFQSQLSAIIFSEISGRLVTRHVITEEDYYKILPLASNDLKMELLATIISKRIRAFEYFVLVLMEEGCHPWLAEELYNAYLSHVAGHIKQLKKTKKCSCPQMTEWEPLSNAATIVKDKLSYVVGKIDHCLYDVIGFMDQTLYPTKNLLEPINKKLPFLNNNEDLPIMENLQLESGNSKFIALQSNEVTPKEISDSDAASQEKDSNRNLTDTNTNVSIQEFDDKLAPETDTPNPKLDEASYNLGLDLEWDNYDLILEDGLIQVPGEKPNRISSQSLGHDPKKKISPVSITPNKPVIASPKKDPKIKNQKSISPNTSTQNGVRPVKHVGKKKAMSSPFLFNPTNKPRLSPSDYVSIQKSIEWFNKRSN